MGSGSSRKQTNLSAPSSVPSDESVTHPTVRPNICERTLRANALNLPPSAVTTLDNATQTSTLDLRSDTSETNKIEAKILPEIKLSTDRRRTIAEDHVRHPRKDLLTNREHRQHIESNWSRVKSITELTDRIANYSDSDLIRTWLIFYWIIKHITNVSNHTDHAVNVVFRTRMADSKGFTHLFSECCRLLNIECVDVHGYVKENWLRIGDKLPKTMHVWNAVKLEGRWYLLDAAWGASTGKEKKLDEFYFLPSPDQMIYTHFPTEETWQLLSPSITEHEFWDLPLVKSAYYRLNLKLISPKQCVIETSESLFEVVVKVPSDVKLTTAIKIGDASYPDFHQLCQYDYTDGMTRCYFSLTNDGTYDLIVYGKTDKEITYVDAIHMRLKVTGLLKAAMFPLLYRAFTRCQCTLIEPFLRALHTGEHVTIRMRIPNAKAVKVHNGDQLLSTSKYENEFLTAEIVVEGDVTIYGIFNPSDQLQHICKFIMV